MRVQKLLTLTLVFLKGAESGKNTGGFYSFFNFCRLQIMFKFKLFKTDEMTVVVTKQLLFNVFASRDY